MNKSLAFTLPLGTEISHILAGMVYLEDIGGRRRGLEVCFGKDYPIYFGGLIGLLVFVECMPVNLHRLLTRRALRCLKFLSFL